MGLGLGTRRARETVPGACFRSHWRFFFCFLRVQYDTWIHWHRTRGGWDGLCLLPWVRSLPPCLGSAPRAFARSHLRQTITQLRNRPPVPCVVPWKLPVQSRKGPSSPGLSCSAARGLSIVAGKAGNSPALAKTQNHDANAGYKAKKVRLVYVPYAWNF